MPDSAQDFVDVCRVRPGSRTVERLGREPVADKSLLRDARRQPAILVRAHELRERKGEIADVAVDVEALAVRREQAERKRRPQERADRQAEQEHAFFG